MARECLPDIGYRAIAIVGHAGNHDGNSAGTVALVSDLLEIRALEVAGAALDGALQSIARHVLGPGPVDRQTQPGVGIGISAARSGRPPSVRGSAC